ncbi:MAG TPA: hypothetical protein VNV44_08670 [Solirubrobacteraceae bacterium]|jgi:hypothetical protein|nr:hypothetical protein [Solirubrobacteraceae bacterium]
MDGKPGPPSRPSGGDAREGGSERYGPLELRRLRKDDGRALIVYARADEAAEARGGEGDAPNAGR